MRTSTTRQSAMGCALAFMRPSTLCMYSARFHSGVRAQPCACKTPVCKI